MNPKVSLTLKVVNPYAGKRHLGRARVLVLMNKRSVIVLEISPVPTRISTSEFHRTMDFLLGYGSALQEVAR